jgi:Mg-chelatase subunit ChlD
MVRAMAMADGLSRRVRLLAPLLDHLPASSSSTPLADALGAARDLLRKTRDGSKIDQVSCQFSSCSSCC